LAYAKAAKPQRCLDFARHDKGSGKGEDYFILVGCTIFALILILKHGEIRLIATFSYIMVFECL
jgi:hypothetical protein